MINLRPFNYLLFILLGFNQVQAQNSLSYTHTFTSRVFNGERKIHISLPDNYHQDSTSSFMVTYVLDAQSDRFWKMAEGNIGYLNESLCVIPMIAVGVVSDNRGAEFSPDASELREHLLTEVFPWIEENLRTKPFRSVVGHSWGGAFVGNTLFSKDADMFDAYIGISPSLGANNNVIIHQADSILKLGNPLKKYFYCSAGDLGIRELESRQEMMHMDSVLNSHPDPSLIWETKVFAGKGHWSCVIPSLSDGLIKMSRNYFADQQLMKEMVQGSDKDLEDQLEEFYQRQQKTFGFTFRPSAKYYLFVANDFRQTGDYNAALSLYHMVQKELPGDITLNLNMAITYTQLENSKAAKKYFKRSKELLEEQKESVSDGFYNSLTEFIGEELEKLK